MIIVLSLILLVTNAKKIKASDYLIQLNETQRSITADIQVNEEFQVFEYPQGALLKTGINSTVDEQICRVNHETITLTANMTQQIIKSDSDMYNTLNDQIVAVINQNGILGFLTEHNNYITFNLHTLEIKQTLSLSEYIKQISTYQTGVYSIESGITLLFYSNLILMIDENGNITKIDIAIEGINQILSSIGYVYIATNFGLHIYQIDSANKNVIYRSAIDINLKISDIALGGDNGDILYILEMDGIHVYHISFPNMAISLVEDSKIPFIEIEFGIAFDQHNDQSIIVLVRPQKHVIFIDIEINLEKGVWFIVNQHYLKINAQNVDINSHFAVIQGVETHYIVRHSLLNQFTKVFNYYSFSLPHSINLDFYQPNFEPNQTIHNWYKNQTKDLLVGVDTDSVILYNWQNIGGNVFCQTDNESLVGQVFITSIFNQHLKFDIDTTLSDCGLKDSFKDDVISKDLIGCRFHHEIILNVIQNIEKYHQNVLTIIIVTLGGALILSLLILVLYRVKTQRELGKFKEKIRNYEKFHGDESQGVRQATPHPGVDNNFKIDDDEQ